MTQPAVAARCDAGDCTNPADPGSRFPTFCTDCAAKYADAAICATPGCRYPVSDVELWTEAAETRIPKYWRERFAEDGNSASPAGLCTECGAEWFFDLEHYRDENTCDGTCTPYDHCVQCLMDESEY